MKIWAYGCSFTAGGELENRQTDPWCMQLAELMGVECINRARDGDSLDSQWLISFEDHWDKQDLILVGVPPWVRAWSSTAQNPWGVTAAHNFAVTSSETVVEMLNWFYFNYLKTLHLWAQDKRVIFVAMGRPQKFKELDKRLLLLEKKALPWTRAYLEGFFGTHPGGHPVKEAHTQLAKRLYKELSTLMRRDNE